jgi:transcriptional regulator with XRE-family HTH domain
VKENQGLRFVLSRNIKAVRVARQMTQAQLAEYADISLSYLVNIESCNTWVSDKTLVNIAKALNVEVYELFLPLNTEEAGKRGAASRLSPRELAKCADAKKKILKKAAADALDDLVQEIIRLSSKR